MLKQCPNCGKPYAYFPELCPIVDVYMGVDGHRKYIYCSEKCLNEVVDKLDNNSLHPVEKVQAISKERISRNPLTWQIVCKPIDLKITLLPENR